MVEDTIRMQSNGKVHQANLSGDEGAGRKEIIRGYATCAERVRFMEISERKR